MTELEKLKEKLTKFVEGQEELVKKAIELNNGVQDEKTEALIKQVEAQKKQADDYYEAMTKRLVTLGMEPEDQKKFSFARAMYGVMSNEWGECGYELDIFKQCQQKAVDTNSGAGGAYIIPVELAVSEIIKPAIAKAVMQKLGAKFITGLTSDLDFPEATSRPSLTFGSDGAQVTAEDIAWALKKLRPKYGKMLVKVSNNLMIQQAAAEAWVKDLMQEGIQIGMDKYAIIGKGSDSEPRGILEYDGTNTTDISSVRMTIDDVQGMVEDIEALDFEPTGILTRSKVKSGLLRERIAQFTAQTYGMPQFDPWMSLSKVEELLGLTFAWTSNVPVASLLTKAVVGKWDEFVIGMWGNIRMKQSDVAGSALAADQTWIAMFVNMDTVLRRPTAFDIASNVSTNF